MSSKITNAETCQVDFYVLGESSPGAENYSCELALMALERNQKIFIIAPTESAGKKLDELMWQYPQGRFLPHARAEDPDAVKAPVQIGTVASLNSTDVVINLCDEAVPQPERFSRILEFVPFANSERQASRAKYKTYRDLGLDPRMQEIKK